MEDLVQAHIAGRPMVKMALAVWYQKSRGVEDQYLLELIVTSGVPFDGFHPDRLSLLWKTGSEGQPYANVEVTSVDYFHSLLEQHPQEIAKYVDSDYEVLYFDKGLLDRELLEMFHIVTDPPGLVKGWYVTQDEYDKLSAGTAQALLSSRRNARPELGLVKASESADFEHCRGILHAEIAGKWLPLSPEGIQAYTYYADVQSGRRAYLLFEGGALYEVLKFEVRTEYTGNLGLLGKTPDDRYPEVYLRAVRPPTRPTA
jgi:hypothetical protein